MCRVRSRSSGNGDQRRCPLAGGSFVHGRTGVRGQAPSRAQRPRGPRGSRPSRYRTGCSGRAFLLLADATRVSGVLSRVLACAERLLWPGWPGLWRGAGAALRASVTIGPRGLERIWHQGAVWSSAVGCLLLGNRRRRQSFAQNSSGGSLSVSARSPRCPISKLTLFPGLEWRPVCRKSLGTRR